MAMAPATAALPGDVSAAIESAALPLALAVIVLFSAMTVVVTPVFVAYSPMDAPEIDARVSSASDDTDELPAISRLNAGDGDPPAESPAELLAFWATLSIVPRPNNAPSAPPMALIFSLAGFGGEGFGSTTAAAAEIE